MKIIGSIFIFWGLLDFGLSWLGVDLYGEIGINLNSVLYKWSPYIASLIGFAILSFGKSSKQDEEE
tara:strand:- start:176 stop:373 length:198 start_codon:yes stop_codon:yes gene_type:complete